MALIETHLLAVSDEDDLLLRLRARTPGAFEELLDLYQQPVYRFVYRLLEDVTEAPDVTQEVFLKIFRKIRGFRGECSLKTWVYRIAVNEASNRRRWFSRHRRHETSVDAVGNGNGSHVESFVDRRESPFDTTYRREQMALVDRTLRGMDERLRCAVILRDIEDLSYSEIAEVMQVSLGTVKSRILRGREALKQKLRHNLPARSTDTCVLQTE